MKFLVSPHNKMEDHKEQAPVLKDQQIDNSENIIEKAENG